MLLAAALAAVLLSPRLSGPAPLPSPQAKHQPVRLIPEDGTPTVQMELAGMNGLIGLTLPELINDASIRLVYSDTNLRNGVAWQSRADGSLVGKWTQKGLAAYQITATPATDGLWLDWRITNLSGREWKDAAGNVCMRSQGVASLFDPLGERTFLRSRGRWVAVKDVWSRPGSNWFLPPGEKPLELMKPLIANGSYGLSKFHPDEAIIAVRSRDGERVLAQAWER
jgi:hypothetical protein